jgi:diketogulonate reductase-like aldo/keto reductase
MAKKYGKTPAQMILRWAVQQEISTIPKSSNSSRLKENFNIFNFQIDEGDISLMNKFDERFRIIDDPMEMY